MSLTASLLAYYKLDGDGNDATGNGNNPISASASWGTTGIINTCAAFGATAVGTAIVYSDLTQFHGATAFSAACWFRTSSFANYQGILTKWDYQTQGTFDLQLAITTGQIFATIPTTINDAGSAYLLTTNGIRLNTWTHLALVYDGGLSVGQRISVYINGLTQSGTLQGTPPTTLTNGTASFRISNFGGTLNNRPIVGNIDEVGLWTRALSPTEVNQVMNYNTGLAYPLTLPSTTGLSNGLQAYWKFDGNSTDATGHGYNGTDTNITYNSTSGKLAQGASFSGNTPGTSKIVVNTIPNLINSSYMSISVWAKFTTIPGTAQLVSQYASTGTVNNQYFLSISGTGVILFGVNDTVGDRYGSSTATASVVTTGIWYNIVGVFDGTQATDSTKVKIYLNGSQLTLNNFANAPMATKVIGPGMTNNIPIWIGTLQTAQASRTLNGSLDEVGIWNRALTSDEVRLLYNNGVAYSYPFQNNGGFFLIN